MECKKCYTELMNIETEDFELCDNFEYGDNTVFIYYSGRCPSCNKTYEWREEYSLNYEGCSYMQEVRDTRLLL